MQTYNSLLLNLFISRFCNFGDLVSVLGPIPSTSMSETFLNQFISGFSPSRALAVLGQSLDHLPHLREQRLRHISKNLKPVKPRRTGAVLGQVSGRVPHRDAVHLLPAHIHLAEVRSDISNGTTTAAHKSHCMVRTKGAASLTVTAKSS